MRRQQNHYEGHARGLAILPDMAALLHPLPDRPRGRQGLPLGGNMPLGALMLSDPGADFRNSAARPGLK
jgi:hypothetical protein